MKMLSKEEKAKMMALPLIDLDENGGNDTDLIIKGIKDVFAAMNSSLVNKVIDGGKYKLSFSHKEDDLTHMVYATYNSEVRFIILTIDFINVPKNKREKMTELINLLNIRFAHACIVMEPEGNLVLKSVTALSGWLNSQELFINLKELLVCGFLFAGAGAKACNSDETPECIIERLDEYIQKNQSKE